MLPRYLSQICASVSQSRSAGAGVFCDELFGVRSQGLLGDDSVAEYGQNIYKFSNSLISS